MAKRLGTQPWKLVPVPYGPIWLYWGSEIAYCENEAQKTQKRLSAQRSRNRGRRR